MADEIPPGTVDLELEVAGRVAFILQPLDQDEQARVLRGLWHLVDDEDPPSGADT
jgi:hypothetical protein